MCPCPIPFFYLFVHRFLHKKQGRIQAICLQITEAAPIIIRMVHHNERLTWRTLLVAVDVAQRAFVILHKNCFTKRPITEPMVWVQSHCLVNQFNPMRKIAIFEVRHGFLLPSGGKSWVNHQGSIGRTLSFEFVNTILCISRIEIRLCAIA